MRRDNLFRPVHAGGLGLAHLFVRQLVSRLGFLRTAFHPFLREFLQVEMPNLLPTLFVSSVANTTPRAWGFIKEIVDSLNFLTVRFSRNYLFTVSRRNLYNDLIDLLFPIPVYRSPPWDGPGHDVLRRVRKMPVSPSTKSFFFKLHTNTLPVKTWLDHRGIFVPWSVNCRLCNQPETIEHCFISCRDAILFWDVLQRTLQKDLYVTPYSIRFLPVPDGQIVPYDVFILIGMHSLWRCRMIDRHCDPPRTTRSLFIEMMSHVREVFDYLCQQPDWYELIIKCTTLPDF